MLDLPEDWVWDFWTAVDGEDVHLFFLTAPRSLGDPDRRHHHARVGHAVSQDLTSWRLLPDALVPQPGPAYDDLATWTGSTVRADDGTWWMFTSGISGMEDARLQRIGLSTSPDLLTWQRHPDLVIEADERWYRRGHDEVLDEHWRDPFVVRDQRGGWHLYITAQAPGTSGHGVVGHATSADLRTWEVGPPLSAPTGRFDQLEVLRVRLIEGRWVVVFSCLGPEMPGEPAGAGGVWTVPVAGPGEPVDVAAAVRLADERWYVGDVVETGGGPVLLAFRNQGDDGEFVGGISDPMPVRWRADGRGLEAAGSTILIAAPLP